MKTRELIDEMNSLPLDERVLILDSLLLSLNSLNQEFEREWLKIAKKRSHEVKSGRLLTVEGEKVFKRIRNRLSK